MYAVNTPVLFTPNESSLENLEVPEGSKFEAVITRCDENDEELPYHVTYFDNGLTQGCWVSADEVSLSTTQTGLTVCQSLLTNVEEGKASFNEIKSGLVAIRAHLAMLETPRANPSGLCSICFEQVEYRSGHWTHVNVDADHTSPAIIPDGQE